MLVPAVGVRELLDLGCLLETLKDLDIGLGWAVAARVSVLDPLMTCCYANDDVGRQDQRCA